MRKASQLMALAERLRSASAAGDWSAVGDADHELAVLLQRAERTAFTPAERTALAVAIAAHAEAAERCSAEAGRIKTRLDDMTANRDGWMAYAVNEWEGQHA